MKSSPLEPWSQVTAPRRNICSWLTAGRSAATVTASAVAAQLLLERVNISHHATLKGDRGGPIQQQIERLILTSPILCPTFGFSMWGVLHTRDVKLVDTTPICSIRTDIWLGLHMSLNIQKTLIRKAISFNFEGQHCRF